MGWNFKRALCRLAVALLFSGISVSYETSTGGTNWRLSGATTAHAQAVVQQVLRGVAKPIALESGTCTINGTTHSLRGRIVTPPQYGTLTIQSGLFLICPQSQIATKVWAYRWTSVDRNVTTDRVVVTLTATYCDSTGCRDMPPVTSTVNIVLEPSKKCEPCAPACGTGCDEGNPISAATGNKFQVETDLTDGKSTGISLTRYYNSLIPTSSAFGTNWGSTWGRRLLVGSGIVQAVRATGRKDTFRLNPATGAYDADPDVRMVLSTAAGGGSWLRKMTPLKATRPQAFSARSRRERAVSPGSHTTPAIV